MRHLSKDMYKYGYLDLVKHLWPKMTSKGTSAHKTYPHRSHGTEIQWEISRNEPVQHSCCCCHLSSKIFAGLIRQRAREALAPAK